MNEIFELKSGETSYRVRMTYGLLNTLCRVVGDTEGAALVALNDDLREAILVEVLSPRNAEGVITQPVVLFNLDASADDVGDLLSWVQDHLFDFFMKALEKLGQRKSSLETMAEGLKPSSSGGVV